MLANGIERLGAGLVAGEPVTPFTLPSRRCLDGDQAVEAIRIFLPGPGDEKRDVEGILRTKAAFATRAKRFVVVGRFLHGAESAGIAGQAFLDLRVAITNHIDRDARARHLDDRQRVRLQVRENTQSLTAEPLANL